MNRVETHARLMQGLELLFALLLLVAAVSEPRGMVLYVGGAAFLLAVVGFQERRLRGRTAWRRAVERDERLETTGRTDAGLPTVRRTVAGRPVTVEPSTRPVTPQRARAARRSQTVVKTPLSTVGPNVGLRLAVREAPRGATGGDDPVWKATAPIRDAGVTGTIDVDESVGVLRFRTVDRIDPDRIHRVIEGVAAVADAVEESVEDGVSGEPTEEETQVETSRS